MHNKRSQQHHFVIMYPQGFSPYRTVAKFVAKELGREVAKGYAYSAGSDLYGVTKRKASEAFGFFDPVPDTAPSFKKIKADPAPTLKRKRVPDAIHFSTPVVTKKRRIMAYGRPHRVYRRRAPVRRYKRRATPYARRRTYAPRRTQYRRAKPATITARKLLSALMK